MRALTIGQILDLTAMTLRQIYFKRKQFMSMPPNMYFAPSVLRVNATTILKRDETDRIAREVEAIKLVTGNTDIPTPCILEKGMDSAGRGYFKMEYIPGYTLRNAWQMMGDHERQSVITELRQNCGP